jgi:hypothetical protein
MILTQPDSSGASSKETGSLDIGWWTEGETFRMSWTEHDGPPMSPPPRRGFGTVVMKETSVASMARSISIMRPQALAFSLSRSECGGEPTLIVQ